MCVSSEPPKNGVSGQLHRRSLFLYHRFNWCLWVCLHFKSLHRRVVFRHCRFIRRKTLASASGSIALTPSFFPSSVPPVHSADLVSTEPIAPVSTIFLSSVQFSGLATPIFSLSSLEPKSLRMIILTIILVLLIALTFDHQNHSKWHK